jgi:hypothetical protein
LWPWTWMVLVLGEGGATPFTSWSTVWTSFLESRQLVKFQKLGWPWSGCDWEKALPQIHPE